MGILRRNGFLYLQGMDKPKFRIPGDRREIKYISIEELADGLQTLIEQNVTASRDGLYKTMTNLLGFSRTGDAIVARFEEALTLLKQQDVVKEEDGLISRKQFNEIPPRVEYSLTDMGRGLLPVFYEIMNWGFKYEDRIYGKPES